MQSSLTIRMQQPGFKISNSSTPVQLVAEPEELNKPSLQPFSFQTVTLNVHRQMVEKPSLTVQSFMEDLGNGVQLAMIEIPAGEFLMGSPSLEEFSLDDEKPQHLVKVPRFYLGQALITQAQWQELMGENPAHFKGDDNLPVECVSWLRAIEFCKKLSEKIGRTYRLPSEAEWEYACRAGTETPFAFGETITPKIVNYGDTHLGIADGDYSKKTTPAGQFPANRFGLYDMHGNLWEWCLDVWADNYNNAPIDGSATKENNLQGSYKKMLYAANTIRGGCWLESAWLCRSAIRSYSAASNSDYAVGFRVAAVPAHHPSRQTIAKTGSKS
jgi:eukaryotic-like serine/threonine-protein kinase